MLWGAETHRLDCDGFIPEEGNGVIILKVDVQDLGPAILFLLRRQTPSSSSGSYLMLIKVCSNATHAGSTQQRVPPDQLQMTVSGAVCRNRARACTDLYNEPVLVALGLWDNVLGAAVAVAVGGGYPIKFLSCTSKYDGLRTGKQVSMTRDSDKVICICSACTVTGRWPCLKQQIGIEGTL